MDREGTINVVIFLGCLVCLATAPSRIIVVFKNAV